MAEKKERTTEGGSSGREGGEAEGWRCGNKEKNGYEVWGATVRRRGVKWEMERDGERARKGNREREGQERGGSSEGRRAGEASQSQETEETG